MTVTTDVIAADLLSPNPNPTGTVWSPLYLKGDELAAN